MRLDKPTMPVMQLGYAICNDAFRSGVPVLWLGERRADLCASIARGARISHDFHFNIAHIIWPGVRLQGYFCAPNFCHRARFCFVAGDSLTPLRLQGGGRAPRGGTKGFSGLLRFSPGSYFKSKVDVTRQALHLFNQTSNRCHNLSSPRC